MTAVAKTHQALQTSAIFLHEGPTTGCNAAYHAIQGSTTRDTERVIDLLLPHVKQRFVKLRCHCDNAILSHDHKRCCTACLAQALQLPWMQYYYRLTGCTW